MKLVQNSMDNWCEHDAHDSYENETTKKRVAGCKEFRPGGLKRINGTHASQNH